MLSCVDPVHVGSAEVVVVVERIDLDFDFIEGGDDFDRTAAPFDAGDMDRSLPRWFEVLIAIVVSGGRPVREGKSALRSDVVLVDLIFLFLLLFFLVRTAAVEYSSRHMFSWWICCTLMRLVVCCCSS